MRNLILLLLAFIITILSTNSARADWPDLGLLISQEYTNNWGKQWDMCPDGNGGVWVTWTDRPYDIWIQHVDNEGNTLWEHPGYRIVDYRPDAQMRPRITSDHNGGAVLAWEDFRNEGLGSDLYAQRVNREGQEQWEHNGIPIIAYEGNQYGQVVVCNSYGYILICWFDSRPDWDTYGQCLTLDGRILWDSTGLAIGPGMNTTFYSCELNTDCLGLFYVAWQDFRDDSITGGIYGQKLDYEGNFYWGPHGRKIGYGKIGGLDFREGFNSTLDGHGGLFITWYDERNVHEDVFAGWIDSTGTSRWGLGGIPIATGYWEQWKPFIEYDLEDGAFITWSIDTEAVQKLQKIKMGPAEDAVQWEENGIIVVDTWELYPVSMIHSAGDEWILTGSRQRFGICQKFNGEGDILWDINGVDPLGGAHGGYFEGSTDGEGGIVAVGGGEGNPLYAQRVYSDGSYPGQTSIDDDFKIVPESHLLLSSYPNPFNSRTNIQFSLPEDNRVQISVYNIFGEEVMRLAEGFYTKGEHKVLWDGCDKSDNDLASGVYFLRVNSETSTALRKITLVK